MSQGGDDLDGLTGFFFYMFIVHPITAWILRPGRFERKKSIMYAIGFLAALAAVKTGTLKINNEYAVEVWFMHRLVFHFCAQFKLIEMKMQVNLISWW